MYGLDDENCVITGSQDPDLVFPLRGIIQYFLIQFTVRL